MIDKFRQWLRSLKEAEKATAVCPGWMSRRGFLRALGVTAVSVSTGGILQVASGLEREESEGGLDREAIGHLVRATLTDLGHIKYSATIEELRTAMMMPRWLVRKVIMPKRIKHAVGG